MSGYIGVNFGERFSDCTGNLKGASAAKKKCSTSKEIAFWAGAGEVSDQHDFKKSSPAWKRESINQASLEPPFRIWDAFQDMQWAP